MFEAASTTCGVYEIRCLVNGRVYVGSSRNVRIRFYNHRSKLRHGKHGNVHLQRCWDKYGEGEFCFDFVDPCDAAQRHDREQARFAQYDWAVLFNIAKDAHRGAGRWGRLGKTNSPEHRARISAALKGRTTWNKGGTTTWAPRAVKTRVSRYDHQIEAAHTDGTCLMFTHEAEAAKHFGYKRKRINESLRQGHRLTTGWAFRKVPKEVGHPDFCLPM